MRKETLSNCCRLSSKAFKSREFWIKRQRRVVCVYIYVCVCIYMCVCVYVCVCADGNQWFGCTQGLVLETEMRVDGQL